MSQDALAPKTKTKHFYSFLGWVRTVAARERGDVSQDAVDVTGDVSEDVGA